MKVKGRMTQAEYSRHRGCHPADVQKALKSGLIHREKDHRIDPQRADREWAAGVNPAAKSAASSQPLSAAAVEAARDVLVAAGFSVSGARTMSFVEARTRNEITKSLMGQLRLREREGTLVDRARAIDAVFALARQERDEWQSWPARVAAILAAELHVDAHKLELALDRLMREHLSTLSDVDVEGALAAARRTPRGASA